MGLKPSKYSAPFEKNEKLFEWLFRGIHCVMRIGIYYGCMNTEVSSNAKFDDAKGIMTIKWCTNEVFDILLEQFPNIIHQKTLYYRYLKKTENSFGLNLEAIGDNSFVLPGKDYIFRIEGDDGIRFPIPLAFADNRKNGEAYKMTIAFEDRNKDKNFRTQGIANYSYPYDGKRLKIPASIDGSDYVNASAITITDKFTFVVAQLPFHENSDKHICADTISMVYHNDVRYVIMIEDMKGKSEEHIGKICHVGSTVNFFERKVSIDVGEDKFETRVGQKMKWKKGFFSRRKPFEATDVMIKHNDGNSKVVTHISVGERSEEETPLLPEDLHLPVTKLQCMAIGFKRFVRLLNIICKKHTKSGIAGPPRILLNSRVEHGISEVFIAMYYLWQLAVRSPKKLEEKELWEHLTDLRLQRWNFVPTFENYQVMSCLFRIVFKGEDSWNQFYWEK